MIWSKWAYKKGKISKEHKRPSTSEIKLAMDDAGFHSKIDNYKDDDVYKSHWVYTDIKQILYKIEDEKQTTLIKIILKIKP